MPGNFSLASRSRRAHGVFMLKSHRAHIALNSHLHHAQIRKSAQMRKMALLACHGCRIEIVFKLKISTL